jgi:uncharacterized protein YraI
MNCSYCESKLFEDDRCCPKCGAPSNNKINKNIFSKRAFPVNIRSGTSMSSPIIGIIMPQDNFDIDYNQGEWSHIKDKGWSMSRYLQVFQ